MADVSPRVFDQVDSSHVPALLLDLIQAAEHSPRAPGRRATGKTLVDVLLRLTLDMKAQFLVQVPLDGLAAKDRTQAITQVAPEFAQHDRQPISRMSETAAVSLRH